MKSYRIATFGCQMNVHDSDRMHEVMQGAGFSEVEAEEGADVIILNTSHDLACPGMLRR